MKNTDTIASNDKIILRDRLAADIDSFLKWQISGQWRHYDAPWESIDMTDKGLQEKRAKFLEMCVQELPVPRTSAIIATAENRPIGWVNRYSHKNSPEAWLLGIDIGEDEYLNKGYGTIALGLWIDYLFKNSSFHRLGLETWSFNRRMIKVAQKLGFMLEGAQLEIRLWQGEWLDLLNFGMLRGEWEKRKQNKA